MGKTLELTLPNGIQVQVEGSEGDTEGRERGLDDPIEHATAAFDDAMAAVRGIADSLQASLSGAMRPPDSVTLKFGINFKVESGVIIAKGSAGANLEITLVWAKG